MSLWHTIEDPHYPVQRLSKVKEMDIRIVCSLNVK